MEEIENKSLSEKVDELYQLQMNQQGTKPKKFKMPLSVRLQPGKFKKQNFIIVGMIKANGAVTFEIKKIEDDTIKVGEYIYSASADCIMRYKRKPLIIIKEWDMQPLSLKQEVNEAVEKGRLVAAQKYILTKMRLEAVKPKMEMNWKIILIVLAIGGIGLWALDNFGIL